MRILLCFGFPVKLGSFRNFNQILIVGGATDFDLCGAKTTGNGLHGWSSVVTCWGDPRIAERGLI